MAAEHVNEAHFMDDDDDDMPPLVDNPYPSMTFTFAANMTPIAYSTDQNSFEVTPEATAPGTFMYSPPAYPMLAPAPKPSHAKKKDASHIPRPPNAFILFRSSFIKAQHIPENVEGNHSALSKIIGKYWKALPREEREVWEAKAIVALAEHRKKYPDWRFRPGANALAKVKDGPRKKKVKKGRGEPEKKGRNKEKRIDKIADLLVAGKKGMDLEVAIEAFDSASGEVPKVEEDGCGMFVMKVQEQPQSPPPANEGCKFVYTEPSTPSNVYQAPRFQREDGRRHSIDATSDARFVMPLTAMFKRSSSAPASHTRGSPAIGAFSADNVLAARRNSFSSISCATESRASTASPPVIDHEARPRAEQEINAAASAQATRELPRRLSPLQPSLLAFSSAIEQDTRLAVHTGCDDSSPTGSFEPDLYSPTLPAFVPDVDDNASPIQSPITSPFDIIPDNDYVQHMDFATGNDNGPMQYANDDYVQPYSAYSSLNGWAGDHMVAKCAADNYSAVHVPYVVTPQYPAVYDPDRIMKDAFEAASFAYTEDLNERFVPTGLVGCPWDPQDLECLQHYEHGIETLNVNRYYGDQRQLFSCSPVSAY